MLAFFVDGWFIILKPFPKRIVLREVSCRLQEWQKLKWRWNLIHSTKLPKMQACALPKIGDTQDSQVHHFRTEQRWGLGAPGTSWHSASSRRQAAYFCQVSSRYLLPKVMVMTFAKLFPEETVEAWSFGTCLRRPGAIYIVFNHWLIDMRYST